MIEASRFLRDANSFVASSRAAIEFNAPHIYISALPFTPKDSLVFRDFSSFLTGVVSVETFGIDRHGGRLVMNLTGHKNYVLSVAYSPDGTQLASGSSDGTVRIWDALTGQETMDPLDSGDGAVRCVVFARNGQSIVSCTEGGTVHIWDARTGRAVISPLRGHSRRIDSIALSPDGRLIASGSADYSVRLWGAKTGQAIAVLSGHDFEVKSVVFSSDGNTLASGSTEGTIHLWHVHTYESQGQLPRVVKGWLLSIAFSPDGSLLAGGFESPHAIHIWNVSTGKEIGAVLEAECSVADLVFAPDGSCLAWTSAHGIRFWDWKTGQDVAPALSGHASSVTALSYSPDGHYIASASCDHTIRIWDAEYSHLMTKELPGHKGSVNSVVVSADGSFIVSGSADRTVRVWDSQTAKPTLPPLIGHTEEVLSVAVSVDGQLIASGSVDQTVRLWNAKTGDPLGEPFTGHSYRVTAVMFSYDVRWLVSASSTGSIGLCPLVGDQRSILRQLNCDSVLLLVALSSSGRLLAVADYQRRDVKIWDIFIDGGHNDVAKMQFGIPAANVGSVCFSLDDSKIAATSSDGKIYVWDIETKSLLQTLERHSIPAEHGAVAYSFDGGRLVSATSTHSVRVSDTSTGRAVATLSGHTATVRSIALFQDRNRFVSGAEDGTIRLWDLVDELNSPSRANVPQAVMLPHPDREDDEQYYFMEEASTWMPHVPRIDLLSYARQESGWLGGLWPDRQLIWLPQEYRAHILISRDRKTLIANHHVVLSVGTVLHLGPEWTKCWRGTKSSSTTGTLV